MGKSRGKNVGATNATAPHSAQLYRDFTSDIVFSNEGADRSATANAVAVIERPDGIDVIFGWNNQIGDRTSTIRVTKIPVWALINLARSSRSSFTEVCKVHIEGIGDFHQLAIEKLAADSTRTIPGFANVIALEIGPWGARVRFGVVVVPARSPVKRLEVPTLHETDVFVPASCAAYLYLELMKTYDDMTARADEKPKFVRDMLVSASTGSEGQES